MISKNCYFGGYINREKKDLRQSNELYQFICNTRKYSEKPILVFDWDSDTRYISNIISKGSGLMRISKDGRASLRNSDEWLEAVSYTHLFQFFLKLWQFAVF